MSHTARFFSDLSLAEAHQIMQAFETQNERHEWLHEHVQEMLAGLPLHQRLHFLITQLVDRLMDIILESDTEGDWDEEAMRLLYEHTCTSIRLFLSASLREFYSAGEPPCP